MKQVIIGSRGSDLALWQAHFVKGELEKLNCSVEIKIIKTQGDQIQHLSFDKLEGKGFFTKEIEDALLKGEVDLAVHSHKDLETTSPEGLIISCVSERANPADVLLVRKDVMVSGNLWSLKHNAVVGTSSARRKSQVLAHRPDVKLKDLRGNVPTRIDKLRQGLYDAILLAKAGVDRLEINLDEFEVVVMDPTSFVPAPAQGVLGLQIRDTDTELHEILQNMNYPDVQRRISLERSVLNKMEGGCQLPLGVYCAEETLYVAYASSGDSPADYFTFALNEIDHSAEKVIEVLQSV